MWYNFCWHLAHLFILLFHRGVRVRGLENVPEGGAVLCPNHTALMDPAYVCMGLGKRRHCHFLAKAEIFKNPIGRWFFHSVGAIPVQRGSADLGALRTGAEVLREQKLLLVFPEGTRTVDGKSLTTGKPVEAKAGCALMASAVNAPLVPVYIHHARDWHSPVTVTFCQPVQDFSKRECSAAVTEVMARIDAVRRESEARP